MKKKYSTPNLIKVVSLSTVMATLLSSVSPVFAANLSITGELVRSTSGASVMYPYGSHGSVVFAGDDDYCGADNVVGRGGKQQQGITDNQRITAKEQYNRFIEDREFFNRHPYGTTTEKVTWAGDGVTINSLSRPMSGYMGTPTGGIVNAMPEAYGVYSFATGCGSAATGNYSTVLGAGATAKAGGAQAFGVSALASGKAAVAMGVGSEASGESSVAIGGLATALGTNSIALGTKVKAEKSYTIAIGTDAEALGSGAIAIGVRRSDRTEENNPNRKVTAKGENAIAIGTHTYAETEDSVAIGANAQVTVYDGVAIGGGSVSDRNKGVKGYDPYLNGDSTETGMAWKSTTGAFSVGEVGGTSNGNLTRQITGVAAGSEDTDAVNVAQLKAMRDVIAGAGGWKLSANDTDPTDVNPGNTVDFSVKSEKEEGKDNLKIKRETADNKHKIEFTLNDHLKLTQVTTGQSTMSDDGFFVNGEDGSRMTVDGFFINGNDGPNMTIDGIDAAKQKITNVADGSEPNDAVNYKQLQEVKNANKTSWQLAVNGGDATAIGPNGTVNFQSADNDGTKNIKIEKDNDHNVTFDLADDIQVMTVTAGDSIMDAAGFRFDGDEGPSITVNGIHAGDKTIKGVAAGEEDTDAVNYKQLTEVRTLAEAGWKLSVDGNNATDVKAGSTVDLVAGENEYGSKNIKIAKDSNKVTFSLSDTLKLTSVTTGNSIMSNDGFTFIDGNGPSITLNGINAGDKKITGVAKGKEDTDAVNYKQLAEVRTLAENGWKLSVDGNNATDVKAGSTVDFVAGENEYGSKNIKIAKDSNKVTFSLNDTLKLTSVTTGNSIMSNDGFKFVDGGPSITVDGIDAYNKKITKVANGTEDTDAVNFKQLKDVTAGIKTGWKLAVEDGEATDVKAGSTVKFVAAADQDEHKNIKIVRGDNNEVTFDLNELIKVNKIKVGDEVTITDNGLVIKRGPSITYGGIDAGDKVIRRVSDGILGTDAVNLNQLKTVEEKIKEVADNSLVKWEEDGKLITIGAEKEGVEINVSNSKDETRVIAGVRAGKIGRNSTEAINGDQLLSITETIADFFGGEQTDIYNGIKPTFTVQKTKHNNVTDAFAAVDTSITNIDNKISDVIENSLVKWDEDEKLITIGKEKDGTKINIAGTDGERTVAGVKNGKISEESTDAINGSQIYSMGSDIAKFFGGNTSFENGVFTGPRYNLSTVSTDGIVAQKTFEDVGSALEGLDVNVKNVSKHIQYVDKKFDDKFDKFSQDALLWSEEEQAFAARHEKDGRKTDSKITYLLNGDISEESTDAINGSQIHSMGSDIAKFFGGNTSFENGAFVGPRYNLSQVSADGNVEQKTFENVGDALTGLDVNVKNVNKHIQYVDKKFDDKFDKFSQDALLWSEEEQAFVALHGQNEQKTDSKIKFLADGDISEESTDAINGSQLYKMGDKIANYFGGGARYENEEWSDPTFKVSQRNEDGTIVEKKHHNVADAFKGVDNSITDIYNQINNVTENSLVKQEGEDGLITVGKATGGTEISLVNKDKQERTLSGVKDGELSQTSTEAVNGSQLFATNEKVTTVTDNLKTVAQNTSKYFGGSTDVLNGIEPAFLIQGETYHNVTEAFTGVNTSITNIDNKISEVVKNSLVKQDGVSAPITIGKDTAGTEINIAGYAGVARSISGVKAAEKGDEAVNKDQLDKSIKDITKDIETVTASAVLYDKGENGNVNYSSVTLGGDKSNGPVALLNVKDGAISQDSHDAINGSQINKISGDIANYFGGGASFENGAFKQPKYSLSTIVEDGQVAKVNYYNVGDALTGLDANVKSVNQRLTNVSNEFNQKIEGISKDALLWDDGEGAFVARHEKDGQKTKSKLKYLLDGEIAKGSTDAITGNQLYLMSNKLANYFGGGAKYANGQWTDPTFKISKVDENGNTAEKEHHNVADAFGDINTGMSNINNRINDVINKVDSDVLHWNKEKGAYDANHDGQPSKIINVADGKVEKGSKDAVNGGQLWETNER
ncbi:MULTISPECIES: hypothetical protein, partial [unclassified Bartonella]|uniref:hypothetical protein n=1 Tax=unclassified Bartonella TaxID=2645622 RepID=UPI0035CEA489